MVVDKARMAKAQGRVRFVLPAWYRATARGWYFGQHAIPCSILRDADASFHSARLQGNIHVNRRLHSIVRRVRQLHELLAELSRIAHVPGRHAAVSDPRIPHAWPTLRWGPVRRAHRRRCKGTRAVASRRGPSAHAAPQNRKTKRQSQTSEDEHFALSARTVAVFLLGVPSPSTAKILIGSWQTAG